MNKCIKAVTFAYLQCLFLANLQATLADSFLADLDELSDNDADIIVSKC